MKPGRSVGASAFQKVPTTTAESTALLTIIRMVDNIWNAPGRRKGGLVWASI